MSGLGTCNRGRQALLHSPGVPDLTSAKAQPLSGRLQDGSSPPRALDRRMTDGTLWAPKSGGGGIPLQDRNGHPLALATGFRVGRGCAPWGWRVAPSGTRARRRGRLPSPRGTAADGSVTFSNCPACAGGSGCASGCVGEKTDVIATPNVPLSPSAKGPTEPGAAHHNLCPQRQAVATHNAPVSALLRLRTAARGASLQRTPPPPAKKKRIEHAHAAHDCPTLHHVFSPAPPEHIDVLAQNARGGGDKKCRGWP